MRNPQVAHWRDRSRRCLTMGGIAAAPNLRPSPACPTMLFRPGSPSGAIGGVEPLLLPRRGETKSFLGRRDSNELFRR
jgi:hypothetical protein